MKPQSRFLDGHGSHPPASHPDVDCASSLLPWEDQKVLVVESVPGLGRNGHISDLECELGIAL